MRSATPPLRTYRHPPAATGGRCLAALLCLLLAGVAICDAR
jgi:hypothetical protein